ncbi:sarcocystatin-A-like isoform X1 [Eurosta solidaginis]|uniref:sarcocystatin-A-like isoform X1 n=1 Tax=Eurosta solidaginis TaxID=178769 RepID=UPI003530E1E0
MLSTKLFLLLSCLVSVALAQSEHLVGGASNADLLEAEKSLNDSLSKLAAGDGPYYESKEVHTATKQVVAGTLLKLNVDLIDKNSQAVKNCNVEIWSRPWLPNGIQVTFDCPDEEKVVKKHSA